MPRGDGTGPAGMGPMTGRGAGFCAGYGMPGFMNPARGQGCGMGWGRGRGGGGRGWRHRYWATGMPGWMRADQAVTPRAPVAPPPEKEKQMLENQVAVLQAQLDAVRRRLETISAKPDDKA